MSDAKHDAPFDIEAFAHRHGMERLSPDHLARMAELAPKIAQLGSGLARPFAKSTAPAERGQLLKSTS